MADILLESWHKVNIENDPVRPKDLACLLFQGDIGANQIGIIPIAGGQESALTGDVTAEVILSDGTTVELVGELRDGRPCVKLTAACCETPGNIVITFAVDGEPVATLAGQVFPVTTGNELNG